MFGAFGPGVISAAATLPFKSTLASSCSVALAGRCCRSRGALCARSRTGSRCRRHRPGAGRLRGPFGEPHGCAQLMRVPASRPRIASPASVKMSDLMSASRIALMAPCAGRACARTSCGAAVTTTTNVRTHLVTRKFHGQNSNRGGLGILGGQKAGINRPAPCSNSGAVYSSAAFSDFAG
jgi:hypothetical protein